MFSSFEVEPSVQRALSNGDPVVALESTIVAHGMPFPQNLQVAQEVESILREKVRYCRTFRAERAKQLSHSLSSVFVVGRDTSNDCCT